MKIKIAFFLLLSPCFIFAQNLSGEVQNENGDALPFVIVLVKESEETNRILYFTKTDNDGKYLIKLDGISIFEEADAFYIEANLLGYHSKGKSIALSKQNSHNYTLDFILAEAVQYLEEVVIVGKAPAYKVKKDTVSFKVAEYSDGSERKIEEIIKKLPGVYVIENTGEILYKGKSVETVTLDGDNLFGFNYALGTKNINVDMVEQIEAIDNYSENPLLKGIEQGGKVSLNLKLKENKTNYSGSIASGLGVFNNGNLAADLGVNALGTSKKFKSFVTSTYNNIGVNRSPFDYFGFNFNVEQQREQNYFAEKIIPETLFSNLLEDSRTNINDQFFGNYNAIFKLSSKLSIKTNLYYLQDRITTEQLFENNFQFNDQNFSTSDHTFITKKPQQYRGDVEIKYNTSKNSLLEYNLRIRQENIETPTRIIQNQTDDFSAFLKTDDFYLKQDLLFTKKLSKRKALQLSLFQSFNDLPQRFSITPSLFDEGLSNDEQESQFKKTFLEGNVTYLGSGKRDKYTFTFGANLESTPFQSRLFNSEAILSENDFDYMKSNIFSRGVYGFNWSNWQVSPSYSIRFLSQDFNQNIENQNQNQHNFIFEPALNVNYELNASSFLTASLGYNQNTNAEQYFFLNRILINNRSTIKNLPSLELQKSQYYSFMYFNNDLYKQFQLETNIIFQKFSGNFFINSDITENTTQIQYFFLPQDNSTWNMILKVSKYIPWMESTIKLTSNYSILNFRNIVNNSELRQNQSQLVSNSLFWKTAFEFPVNFQNSFTWRYSNSQSQNQNGFENNALQNSTKLIVNANKKWMLIVSLDYYLPDTHKKDEQFFFLDAVLQYRPKNKKWTASFVMSNLINEDNFEQVQTSDISTTVFRSNLLSRCFITNLIWSF